jgi:hypothetical protein
MRAADWTKPEFRRAEIDSARRRFTQLMRKTGNFIGEEMGDWHNSLDIINNWRASHA